MKRKFWLYIILVLLVVPANLEAQRWKLQRYEAVFGLGTTHPFMDIAPSADSWRSFHLVGTRPIGTFGVNYKIVEPLSVGVDLSYAIFGGLDVEKRMSVNSFISHSFEHAAIVRYSFISNGRAFGSSALFNRRGMVNNYNSADFYLFAGVGGILSKSKAFDINNEEVLEDHWHDNNMHYGVVFPVGFGFKYSIDSDWSFGVEVGGRFSLTDWLDGYATDYSNYNDRYIITNFRAIYKIQNDRKGRPRLGGYRR